MSEQEIDYLVGGCRYSSSSPPTKEKLFRAWENGGGGGIIATKEAKQWYFLTTDDLRMLPHRSEGYLGFGTGPPMKCYRHSNLIEAALAKHGRDGVVKKLAAKDKRERNKLHKERQAEEARKRMKTINDNATNTAAATATGTASVASSSTSSGCIVKDSKEIIKLRNSLLKLAKKNMGFERSGAPKHWRFEVPGTTKATFAALMRQPNDTELSTFVKNGAYYTIEYYNAKNFFGKDNDNDLTKNFKREGVSQKIGESVVVRYKPCDMELSVSGYAEISGAFYY